MTGCGTYVIISNLLAVDPNVSQRIAAPCKNVSRCKLGVIAEANADFALAVKPAMLAPYTSHFFPNVEVSAGRRAEQKRMGYPMVAATFTPKAKPVSKVTPANLQKVKQYVFLDYQCKIPG